VRQALARQAEAVSDWIAAAEHWRAALTVDPDASWISAALSVVLVRQGRPDEAATMLVDRLRSHPADIVCICAHARSHGAAGLGHNLIIWS
jgi:predicted Zn-dependent protease